MWLLCSIPVLVFSIFSGICLAAPGRGVVTNAKVSPGCSGGCALGVVSLIAPSRPASLKPEVPPLASSTEINTPAPPGDNALTSSKSKDQCRDEGIWIVDGLIDCKYLLIQGDWGVASQARRRCTRDSSTNCCQTCRKLGFVAGSPNPSAIQPTTTTTHLTTQGQSTQSPSSTKSHIGGKLGPLDPTCVDNHVWIADMAVECRYLEVDSVYGLHSRPEYFCRNYSLTDCCWTCDKLGLGKGSNTNPPAQKLVATTAAVVVMDTITTPTTTASNQDPPCRDVGIWTRTGLLSCKYLERKSIYNVHENPLQACANPWTTWCCETCARIRGVKPNQINGNIFGISRKVKLQGLSNKIL